jgi:hypothetical protein
VKGVLNWCVWSFPLIVPIRSVVKKRAVPVGPLIERSRLASLKDPGKGKSVPTVTVSPALKYAARLDRRLLRERKGLPMISTSDRCRFVEMPSCLSAASIRRMIYPP